MSGWNRILPFLTLLLLASCGGRGAPPFRSETLTREITLSGKAEKASRRGKHTRAIELTLESLRLSRTIENIDGTATSLINLAVLFRTVGESNPEDGLFPILRRCVKDGLLREQDIPLLAKAFLRELADVGN